MSDIQTLIVGGTSYSIKAPSVVNQNSSTGLKLWTGLSSAYTTLTKDNNTLYYVTDTQSVYLGSTLIVSGVYPLQKINTLTAGASVAIPLTDIQSLFALTPNQATTLSFTNNTSASATAAYTFELCINMSTVYAITFPASITWQGGEDPDLSEAGKYLFAFRTMDGGSTWIGNLQGVW